MSDQNIKSDLVEELSTEEQQLLSGGHWGPGGGGWGPYGGGRGWGPPRRGRWGWGPHRRW